ncbi:MAG: fused MFS/spermidine synthase [Oligoflexia bacterium]|nr:fused MFS/spermidine synthase [Oligoflexia bacterium]
MNIKINNKQIFFSFITILSGFCGIFFETLSNKVFTYLYGVTIVATTMTLVLFFIGMFLGSLVLSRIAKVTKAPLLLYLTIESLLSLYLLIYPTFYNLSFDLLNSTTDGTVRLLIDILIPLLLLVIPTFIMGGTIPCLYRIVSNLYSNDQYLPYYYGLNTLGAAFGVFVSSYLLFPSLGLQQSAYLAGAVNLVVVYLLLIYRKKTNEEIFFEHGNVKFDFKNIILHFHKIKCNQVDWCYLGASCLSGLFVFAIEIVWFNLLALIIGNSVYAFAVMLVSILFGIGLGGYIISKIEIKDKLKFLRFSQVLLVVYLYCSLFLWDKLGNVFTFVGTFGPSFFVMELTRFIVTFFMLIIPCLIIGMSFPLLLQNYTKIESNPTTATGYLYAANALGSALGALLGCFVLINYFGNKQSINIIGTLPLLIVIITLALDRNKCQRLTKQWLILILVILVSRFFFTPNWNLSAMTGGQNIYFSKGNTSDDKILFHKESTHSGVITLIDKKGVKTLYTNGKFEGNDATEILDQYLFATIPAIFSEKYNSAANLGLGVGGSLGAITQFPYANIDVVEISPEIIKVAKDHFSLINFNALENHRVKTNIEDGRIFFMTNKNKYDLITMELTSVWFAGSSNLYSREFYQIINDSLNERGIFQQWIQLHHISLANIAVIIKTLKEVFSNPTLWIMGHQAILIAKKNGKLNINYSKLIEFEKDKKISSLLKKIGYKSIFQIFNHLILSEENIDLFIKDIESKSGVALEINSDMNPLLEFATPKGNAFKNDNFSENRQTLFDYKWFDIRNIILGIPGAKEHKKIIEDMYFDTRDDFEKI